MKAGETIRSMREKGQTVVLEKEAKEVLQLAGIPTTRCYVVDSAQEACSKAEKIGYPVVLKISSLLFMHKWEMGGVVLNLTTSGDLSAAYEQLLDRGRLHDPNAGITIQKMAPPGVELIAGATTDPHFGTVLMLGTGGIFTELLQDMVFRLPPLADADALEMVHSLRSKPLLKGYRSRKMSDIEAVQGALLCLSELLGQSPEIKELDINPLVVYQRGVLALDARMILK